tara:strand:- start:35755 stop:36093 length:339 start_codon:yes stop_codon:yes gene_type:complete
MTAKFTRGDWKICPIEQDKEYIRIRGTRIGGIYKIANVIDLKNHHDGSVWCALDREQAMANAHLFKTAPKLYNFLESILDTCLDESQNNEIKDLLAEARGEQNDKHSIKTTN